MKRGLSLSRLRDWRIAGPVGLLAGFLIGLLVFGEPWHLPPAWGDIPTWLAAIFAGIAGIAAFSQLGMLRQQLSDQRQQIADEAERNARRDELISRQLSEARRRADSDWRMQAEGVEVYWYNRGSSRVLAVVENKSRRPITRITCRLMSNADRSILKMPDGCGDVPRGEDGILNTFILGERPVGEFGVLRPQSVCGFIFSGVTLNNDSIKEQTFVAWFNDDAGFRWQLDEHLHLVNVIDGDESEYLP